MLKRLENKKIQVFFTFGSKNAIILYISLLDKILTEISLIKTKTEIMF